MPPVLGLSLPCVPLYETVFCESEVLRNHHANR